MNIFSYGGGVQSFTILALIAHGKLPKPDKIVMCDMSPYEPDTMAFTAEIAQPLAWKFGSDIQYLKPKKSLRMALLAGRVITPFWWLKDGRAQLVSRRGCTTDFKVKLVNDVIKRYMWDTIWLGISTDELKRQREEDEKLTNGRMRTNAYPLIAMGFSRVECEEYLTLHGLPVPPKSACRICPFSSRIRLLKNLAQDTGTYEQIQEVESVWHKNPKHAHKYLTIYLDKLPTPEQARVMLVEKGFSEYDNSGACGVCEF